MESPGRQGLTASGVPEVMAVTGGLEPERRTAREQVALPVAWVPQLLIQVPLQLFRAQMVVTAQMARWLKTRAQAVVAVAAAAEQVSFPPILYSKAKRLLAAAAVVTGDVVSLPGLQRIQAVVLPVAVVMVVQVSIMGVLQLPKIPAQFREAVAEMVATAQAG
ncbi:hypothetical protein CQ052_18430 [Ochrobactrum sp. MYb15]|nr:hypothetical protein CQZ90_15990 [Ochrobactrum sp. MYb19]PRA64574.1 hypothetical protein CQ053_14515 [Ochrobactrum sp. MYb18]PRA74914.1 hypothetical protein CQ049_17170 [Brucella thiophenivorans]PRA89873.1 hypothetical protein CQ051_16430 [Ochrobactrum sp. MYb14]PRA96905.1 hypothetical protein CQ052_18430 [Ochrobactrum sp. MYb15]